MNQTQIKCNKKTLIIIAVFFVFAYSILAFKSGNVFNSPDENANYFFSNLFVNESRLDYPLPENSDIIHPRSMTVASQKIVPQSFLGMPLIYGFLGKIFGSNAIIFFTPVIAAISVLFFYEIIKKIFNEKIAFLSGILVFIHPAFWYYSTHSMYHNVLFVSFLIMGVYFFIGNSAIAAGRFNGA
ncbi:MAG: glycosyltransferase family 39 protein, partial [bacterium]